MQTITLTYEQRTAALAAPERFWLAAHIEARPDGDPTKRLVTFMATYARDILAGELPEPYTDERARRFARLALVEPTTYHAHRRSRDAELADVLGLPLGEIPDVRREQQALASARAAARRTRSRTHHHTSRQRPARR
jgi:hypothetical protein